MESESNQIKPELINEFKLFESQWSIVHPLLKHLVIDKKWQVNAEPGDLFYVVSGFVFENQEMGDSDPKMVRLFIEKEVFVFPERIRDSRLICAEKSWLVKIGIEHKEKIRQQAYELYQLWEDKKRCAPEIYNKRQALLSGRKNLRYERFLQEFPGAAAHLSNRILSGYLDVNSTYLSTSKNQRKNRKKEFE